MKLERVPEILLRQWIVVCATLFIGFVVFLWAMTLGRQYSATATLLATPGSQRSTLDPSKDPLNSAIAPQDIPALLHSSTVIDHVATTLRLDGKHVAALGKGIKAHTSLGSDLIPVTVTDRDARMAVREVNVLGAELQRFEQQIAMSRYDLLIADLRAQLTQRATSLHEIDGKIAALSASDPFITADNGNSAINLRLMQLEQQRDQLRTTMLGDAKAAAIAAQRPRLARDLASREIVLNDPVFQSLRTQYGKDLAQLNVMKAGYTDNFPGLSGLNDQVTREARSMQSEETRATSQPDKSASYVNALLDKNKADATYQGDRAQLASLDGEIRDMTAHLQGSRDAATAVAALRRDRDAGTQQYTELSNRLGQALADRSQAGSINAVVILDKATDAAPTMLSRPSVVGVALAIVFAWLAITLAFVADAADGRLRTRTTIEELYGKPVLTQVR